MPAEITQIQDLSLFYKRDIKHITKQISKIIEPKKVTGEPYDKKDFNR